MEKMRTSVAMATFNGEEYIEKQLISILEQTLQVDEVIICDDFSTDATVEIVRNFIESRQLQSWHLFTNQRNEGYKKNFYKAISKASGDVIFLADQDDEWCGNKIECMMEVIDENKQIFSLNCAVRLINTDSEEIPYGCEKNYYNCDFTYMEHIPEKVEFLSPAYIAKHNVSPGCTMAITRPLAQMFLNLYNFELPHDWFLNLLAAAKGGCAFLNEPLIRYRRHNNNVIGANNGVVAGIKKKTRSVRMEDYRFRIRAINVLLNDTDMESGAEEVNRVLDLYNKMVQFYKNPSLTKLFKIRRIPDYYELSKKKVRIWEFVVAMRVDTVIRKMIR